MSEDLTELIKSSLAPAEDISVSLDKESKTAKVLAPEDQLSVAIGKDGQNVRLTAKLTGYRIEIEGNGKEASQAEEEETKEEVKKESKDEEKPVEEPKSEVKAEEVKTQEDIKPVEK
jgi:N utilization substance protein A